MSDTCYYCGEHLGDGPAHVINDHAACDRCKRRNDGESIPSYGLLNGLGFLTMVVGLLVCAIGVVVLLYSTRAGLDDRAMVALQGLGLVMIGLVSGGSGQAMLALRDIARNSFR